MQGNYTKMLVSQIHSSGPSSVVPDTRQMREKCVAGTHLITAAATTGNCVVYRLKTFAARFILLNQQLVHTNTYTYNISPLIHVLAVKHDQIAIPIFKT